MPVCECILKFLIQTTFNNIVRLDMEMHSPEQNYVVELTLALTIWYYACPCA